MSAKLSPEQTLALETRSVSVALSAGAGCGKTFVLTERFLSHLEPANQTDKLNTDLTNLMAITFTDRAAREMRGRVRQKCRQRMLSAGPGDYLFWQDLLQRLDQARICTIHALCTSLLREHAPLVGVDPDFTVAGTVESATLLNQSIDHVLETSLIAGAESTISAVAELGLPAVKSHLSNLVDLRDRIDFSSWLSQSPETTVDQWQTYFTEIYLPKVHQAIAFSERVQTVWQLMSDNLPRYPEMQKRRQLILDAISRLQAPQQLDAVKLIGTLDVLREAAKVQGTKMKEDWDGDGALYDQIKRAFTKLRDDFKDVTGALTFDGQTALKEARRGKDILHLAQQVVEHFMTSKQSQAMLDFNDLISLATQLLSRPDAAKLRGRLSQQIHMLLVDEFQDTDPAQARLVRVLMDDCITDGRLFFVGDHKQSIYRFRRADPRVFHAMRAEIPAAGQLPLTLNFRSQPAILQFVNALFEEALGPQYEALRPHKPQLSPVPAVEFLWAELKENEAKSNRAEEKELEARFIARRLKQLLSDGVPRVAEADPAQPGQQRLRPLKPGDITILLRAMSDAAEYEQALAAVGLHYYVVGGKAFYAQQEIYDLLNVLKAVIRPHDQASLLGALRGGFFGVSDTALYWLSRQTGDLCQGLKQIPEHLPANDRRQLTFAAETLQLLAANKDRLRLTEVLQLLLDKTGYDAALLGEFMGERKLANLQKLLEMARDIDKRVSFGFDEFIDQLDELVERQPEEPLAVTHPEFSDVIRLMSIHQSKGLEFPLVVVADLNRGRHPGAQAAAFDPDLGPLVPAPADQGNALASGLSMYKFLEDLQEEAERVRLLYVACTRAADYLILSTGLNALESANSVWMGLLAKRFDLRTGKRLSANASEDELPLASVTMTEPELPEEKSPSKRGPSLETVLESARTVLQQPAPAPPLELQKVAEGLDPLRQFSFSQLKSELLPRLEPTLEWDDENLLPEPDGDPRAVGNLVHAALARLAPGSTRSADDLFNSVLYRFGDVAEQPRRAALALLREFLQTDKARQIRAAMHVHTEIEFQLAWPPNAPVADFSIHGFIDCLYQDAGGKWHLLDYKSNKVGPAMLKNAADGHRTQLQVYALAAEAALGVPLASCELYFLSPQRAMPITLPVNEHEVDAWLKKTAARWYSHPAQEVMRAGPARNQTAAVAK